jgi:phospholipase/lecithinase/hemolysin
MSKSSQSLFHLGCGVAVSALIAAATPAAAGPVTGLVVFGDSASDLGSQGLALRPTNQGQMWSERLAGNLGLPMKVAREFRLSPDGETLQILKPGGSNYAVNGSTVLDFDCCLSFRQQVDFFVEDKKRFSGGEIAFVYFDRNDLEAAFSEGLPYSVEAFAGEYIAQVKRLQGLGAKNIVALGADLDFIPAQFALDTGRATPETLVQLRAETLKQRTALFPQLQKLNVYVIDLDVLGVDMVANPRKYGFTATTGSYQQRGNPNPPPSQSLPNDGNAFTLDGHLTTAAQAVVADYTLAQLRARDQSANLLAQSALDQRAARTLLSSFRSAGEPGWRLDAAPFAGQIDQKADGPLDSGTRQTYQGLAFGAQRNFEGGLILGGGISLRAFEGDFTGGRGKAEGTAGLLSVFVAQPVAKGVSIDAHAAYGATGFSEIERRAALGAVARERATGSTRGEQTSAGLGVRVEQDWNGWRLAGRVGAEYERTEMVGYADKKSVLALNYGDSRFESALGRLDVEIARTGDDALRPFLVFSATHDVLDDDIDVKVGPSSGTLVTYSTRRGLRTQLAGELGVDYQVNWAWTLRTSLTGSTWSGEGGGASASGVNVRATRTF